MKKIYSELSRIQQELKAPKNLWNKFGNYHYRNAEGILEAVKPLLNGLALIVNDEPVVVGDRFYIKATVTLTNGDESVSAVAYAREDGEKKGMDGCQLTGACSSYARKYALNALLMIDDSKDSDDNSLSPKNPENAEVEKKNETKKQTEQKQNVQAEVTQITKIPKQEEPKQEKPKQEEPTEAMAYLLKEMKNLRIARGISAKANNELFKKQMEKLIEAELVPNKNITEYTLEEAKVLIDAMYKNFTPDGTEVQQK